MVVQGSCRRWQRRPERRGQFQVRLRRRRLRLRWLANGSSHVVAALFSSSFLVAGTMEEGKQVFLSPEEGRRVLLPRRISSLSFSLYWRRVLLIYPLSTLSTIIYGHGSLILWCTSPDLASAALRRWRRRVRGGWRREKARHFILFRFGGKIASFHVCNHILELGPWPLHHDHDSLPAILSPAAQCNTLGFHHHGKSDNGGRCACLHPKYNWLSSCSAHTHEHRPDDMFSRPLDHRHRMLRGVLRGRYVRWHGRTKI